MSTTAVRPHVVSRSSGTGRRVELVCYTVGAVLMAEGMLHLLMFVLEPRPWAGPLSWRKPVTFGVSFGLMLVSITWITSYLVLSERKRQWLLGLLAVDCVVEVGGITLQAWRHVPSHFNTTTTLNSGVAFSLAAGGAVLIATLGTMAVSALRGRVRATPAMRLALRAGFALLLVGLGSGVVMIVRGTTLSRTGHLAAAYSEGGFLTLFHAVALQALFVLASLAWLLGRSRGDHRHDVSVIRWAVTGYLTLAAGALVAGLVA